MPTMLEIWKTEGKTELLLAILRKKFDRVPKVMEQTILAMTDPIALESWAVQASMCQSLDEFIEDLK